MSGCRGCLGRLILLVLVAWLIGGLARALGWSDTTTGGLFLVVLALLAIRGSRRGRVSGARVTRRPVAPEPVPRAPRAVGSSRGWDGSLGPDSSGLRRTSPGHPLRRARDPLPAALRFRILARDGFRCRYCGRQGTEPGVVLHVDHVVPVIAGGTTSEDNLRTACEECNLGKGTPGVVAGGSWSGISSVDRYLERRSACVTRLRTGRHRSRVGAPPIRLGRAGPASLLRAASD